MGAQRANSRTSASERGTQTGWISHHAAIPRTPSSTRPASRTWPEQDRVRVMDSAKKVRRQTNAGPQANPGADSADHDCRHHTDMRAEPPADSASDSGTYEPQEPGHGAVTRSDIRSTANLAPGGDLPDRMARES
jgi:hypothetical protein